MKLNDKTELRILRDKIEEALSLISDDLGVRFDVGNCRYEPDGQSCKFGLEVATAGSADPQERKAEQEYKTLVKYDQLGGFTLEHLGKKFTNRGSTYTLVGVKPRARKSRLLGKRVPDGALYRFNEDFVAKQLGCETIVTVSDMPLLQTRKH